MKETPNYYSIIPAEVRYDKNLRDKSKLLYGEITSLCNKYGYCYASNKYFAELYEVSKTTISTLVKELIDNGYIISEIQYKEGTKEILNRYLKLSKEGYLKNFKEGIKENLKDNNINNNITSNNNKKVFIKPTIEEIEEYCKERNNDINAYEFYDFYEAKGWCIGKEKMKDWKACVRTWERRNNKAKEPEWFDKTKPKEQITKEEERELKELFKEFY